MPKKSEKFLTRDDILAADDMAYQNVSVPEWGGSVRVRTLCGADRSRIMALQPVLPV